MPWSSLQLLKFVTLPFFSFCYVQNVTYFRLMGHYVNASVLFPDLLAGNGIIHVIDKIMWHVGDYQETSSVSQLWLSWGFVTATLRKNIVGGGGGYGARRFSYLQYLLPRCSHPCYSPIPHSPDFSYGMHEHAVLTLNHMLVQWHLHVYRDTNLCIILGLNIVSQRDRFFSHRYHPWRFFTERVDFRFLHQFCRYELSNDSYGLFF